MGLVIAWKVSEVMSKHILNRKMRLNLKSNQEVQVQRVVAQISQIEGIALYLRIRVDLIPELDS
ncbi:uncharacterized protein G2W53_003816 [Senna tora]|uniref:Uncharacterized protein n=1 Tax=Senna tora TaxID=362788 RepID=A0A834XBW0_9FABA|nr:uncharacterized protein G2W53_003816 [Senna tora]